MKNPMTMSQDLLEGNFISVDLETTGLNPLKDTIIEVGMVRMSHGEIHDTYDQLINPGIPIPSTITQITGIQNQDCQDQPVLETVLPDILEFIGDQWIIAHNADFDYNFLNQAKKKFAQNNQHFIYSHVLDTLTLSRLLHPWLPNHRLNTIREALNIKNKPLHRALADAKTTALVFQKLIIRACSLHISQIEIIITLLTGAKHGLRLFFEKVKNHVETHGATDTFSVTLPDNILGSVKSTEKRLKDSTANEKSIETFFDINGPLSCHLDHYEMRSPQIAMSKAVVQSLNQKEFLMAEAGTGIGKSIAYLTPAALWSSENQNNRIVISTHTKTLQNQLFQKELPLLQEIYPKQFSSVLLKGRSNYLCKRRYTLLLTRLLERLSPSQRSRLIPLIVWADLTKTGDIEENAGFHRNSNSAIWSLINCESGHCLSSQCAFYQDCFLQRIRKASRSASFVIINHALLFSSLTQSHSILGDFDSLIVDEAHQIERVASQQLGIVLNMRLFWDIVQGLYQSKPEEVGILMVLKHYLSTCKSTDINHAEIDQQIDVLIQLVHVVLQQAQQFFQRLNVYADSRIQQNGAQSRIRLRQASEIQQALGIIYGQTIQAVDTLSDKLQSLVSYIAPLNLSEDPEAENLEQELSTVFDRLLQLQISLNHFQEVDYSEYVIWCEKRTYQENQEIVLRSVPLDIARILANTLYANLDRCIMTSATLTVGNQFDYIINRLGLNRIDQDRLHTQIFGSPFHYPDQVLFLIPSFLPYPKADSYTYHVGRFIESVICTHPKGTLVLFTSYKMLNEVYSLIQPHLEAKGIELLGQGISGSHSALLKSFIDNEQSVLLGTASFWEGVDVPGKSLEMLVITRIPFDVPTEPLVQARMEEEEKKSGSGFLNYTVPEAVVKFRQGFGRLIRTADDHGVVMLLDRRMIKSRYGQLFLSSLPVEPVVCDLEQNVMSHLENWFS